MRAQPATATLPVELVDEPDRERRVGEDRRADLDRDCPDREEVQRTCLEAHETLMEINPNNVPRFKDVARFLAEDLKKMEEAKKE